MKKPVLGAFLNGVPDVENLFPILSDLHARGDVEVRVFVTSASGGANRACGKC